MSDDAKCREYIGAYINRARDAQKKFEEMSQQQVDTACMIIARTVYNNAEMLAEMAVRETGMGNVHDKTAKNRSKARVIWNSLKGKKSRGIIETDETSGITRIAKPMGVVAAITPCTNPIVTPMSNAMFALKCGNAIIITPHHRSVKCSTRTVEMINDELDKAGMPKHLIQILDEHSRENTRILTESADVVVATGGSGMVHAAYSSGRPALGVGAGNVQCIIDQEYDFREAVPKIIAGRGFDNGIICSGEQSVICPADDFDRIMDEFRNGGAYVADDPDEITGLENALFDDFKASRHSVGQNAVKIAELAGMKIPQETKIIVACTGNRSGGDLLGREKMAPVLAAYACDSFEDAVSIAEANLENDGKGHSVAIHSDNRKHIEYAGERLCVSRFVVNQSCASTAGGSFYNGLAPTNTLGCGSWGHNSISENLSYKHLMNISRIAYFVPGNKAPDDEELWNI